MDVIIAGAMLSLVAVSVIYGLTRANWSAANDRNRSAAKALCQERIEQALAVTYNPPRQIPALFGGPAAVPAPETSTIVDTVPIYSDGATAATVVTGTRTCSVSRQPNDLVRFSVGVTWDFRGRTYRYDMFTLRSPDSLR